MTYIIPYDQKVDVALDSFQTFVHTFSELKSYYHALPPDKLDVHTAVKCITEGQDAVNHALLDLLSAMMEDAYPRVRNY